MELVLDGGKLKKDIKLDSKNNCGIMWSSPCYDDYSRFMAMVGTINQLILLSHQYWHKMCQITALTYRP